MKRKSSKLPAIIVVTTIILIIGSFLLYQFINRDRYNDEIVYGNSAGNYYNKGLFCEYNGVVYFSNPYDKYTLYSMTPQGTDAKKIGEDNVGSINVDENYIYYVRDNGSYQQSFQFLSVNTNSLCRVNKNGKNHKILDSDPSLYASLAGNYIYYIHYDTKEASTLYKVKIDGKEKQKLSASPFLLSQADNGTLCYNNIENDRNIMSWDASTDTSSLIFEEDAYHPISTDSYIYFMDSGNNFQLARIHKSSGEKEVISDARIECYNIYGNYIYYQTNDADDPALYRRSLDNLYNEERISSGIYCDINITSNYVYFRSFQNKDTFYQTPTNGAINVQLMSVE